MQLKATHRSEQGTLYENAIMSVVSDLETKTKIICLGLYKLKKRSYLLLKSRLITGQLYILVTSIKSCNLANKFYALKEHESKIELMTIMRTFNPKFEAITSFSN